MLASLRCPSIRLRSTFPILSPNMDTTDSLKKQLSPSDNSGLPMMPRIDTHFYPILVEQMSYRSQVCSLYQLFFIFMNRQYLKFMYIYKHNYKILKFFLIQKYL